MARSFKDHFSKQASSYSNFRPRYPNELFDFLAQVAPARNLAWDVGTGNGQAATELARKFKRVIATDPSADQIKNATSATNIDYRVAPAEHPNFHDEKFDLITVAQAVHWFQFDEFYAQVKAHGAPRAKLALWTYTMAKIEPEIDAIVDNYYSNDLKEYWPPERHWVDEEYRTLPFPFAEIATPNFEIVEPRTLSQWIGYLFTWSATQNLIRTRGDTVFERVVTELTAAWGPENESKVVRWPIFLRLGEV